LALAATFIIKFLGWTCRFQLKFPDDKARARFENALFKNQEQFLLGFFHQDELCLMPYFQNKKLAVLVSLSKDGEIMRKVAQRLGVATVRGSSSRGAARGLLAAIKKVREGYHFALAVDGPRGPIYKVKEGLPAISQKTKTPILPVRAFPSKAKIFSRSWNQAKLPLPFSKITLKFGDLKMYSSQELEKALKAL
ncbi:MAG: lysophospholipid acyltransferase family protein, partial [Bacteriovoracaceae bacterium]